VTWVPSDSNASTTGRRKFHMFQEALAVIITCMEFPFRSANK
jgi:hypothetical protein